MHLTATCETATGWSESSPERLDTLIVHNKRTVASREGRASHHQEKLTMPTGTVKWFNATKGYGFIEPEDGSKDAFVHISAVERAGLGTLREGQRISYEVRPGRDGKTSAEELSVTE